MSAHRQGQTLIELLMLITVVSLASVATLRLATDGQNESRFTETKNRLLRIRSALVGDPSLMQAGARSAFGYQGDLGALPTVGQGLAALWTAPAGVPAFAMNAAAKIGLGWNGPYLDTTV